MVKCKCVCKVKASLGLEDGKPIWCAQCPDKLDNARDVVDKKCLTPLCGRMVSNKQYQGYCLRCFIHVFPDQTVSKNYKIKERYVTDFLDEFVGLYSTSDKRIPDDCSLKRPDKFWDIGSHSVIKETDENQHKSYDNSCDNKRNIELFQDGGNRPIVIIRFNPDSYKDKEGKSCKGCFKLDKRGILGVRNYNVNMMY